MIITAHNRRLGRIGIAAIELRRCDRGLAKEAATELDELGFGAIWIPGGLDSAVLDDVQFLLSATRRIVIATGILNIWQHAPADVAHWWKARDDGEQARAMFGLGVSHGPLVGDAYRNPVALMRDYIDAVERNCIPADRLCLAALGPKMLALARDRTLGAHPHLVTPEYSAMARAILGPDRLLVPKQGVVFESDPQRARDMTRAAITHHRKLPNYANNWRRMGFSEADIADLSDRLIDALFAWGSADRIVERIRAHQAAGADHVCVQVITGADTDIGPLRALWRELAAALL